MFSQMIGYVKCFKNKNNNNIGNNDNKSKGFLDYCPSRLLIISC